MERLAIRCVALAPVSAEEVEEWLRQELDRLRAAVPQATLRLLRLTQAAPSGELETGWLIELDSAQPESELDEGELDAVVRDMRLLGLQPIVLRTPGASDSRTIRHGEEGARGDVI